MMKSRVLACSFVVAAAASVHGGCSSSDSAAGIAFKDLPPKYAAAACAAYKRCFGPVFDLFLNGSNCDDLTANRLLNGTFAETENAITRGTVRYDGSLIQACLDSLSTESCSDTLLRDKPECLKALDGTVPLGKDCILDEECAGSAICRSASGTCPGTCVAHREAGQPCEVESDCADGLQCSNETTLCVKPSAVGEACEYGAPPCGPGLLCLGKNDDKKTSGTCRNAVEAMSAKDGADCDPVAGTLCAPGVSCVADSIDIASAKIAWKCVAKGTYVAAAACKPGFPDACANGNYCNTGTGLAALTGVCTAVPEAKQACGTGIGAECQVGAVCVSGLCQNYASNGVGCTGDAMCYSEYCGPSGGCEPRLPCK